MMVSIPPLSIAGRGIRVLADVVAHARARAKSSSRGERSRSRAMDPRSEAIETTMMVSIPPLSIAGDALQGLGMSSRTHERGLSPRQEVMAAGAGDGPALGGDRNHHDGF